MSDVIEFEGRQWIDAQFEYFKLPASLQISDNKWDRRLRALGIRSVLPDVRTCERGNIATLMEEGRAFKSKFVAKSVWDAAIAQALASVLDTPRDLEPPVGEGQELSDESVRVEEQQEENPRIRSLARIDLDDAEHLYHNGQNLNIKAYGERTMDGLFLDARDVCNAIGTRLEDAPNAVTVDQAIIAGKTTSVLLWDDFCTLAVLKAHGHPVAAAIKKWIVSTVFSVQFQGGAGALPQAASEGIVFASRKQRYSPATYTNHLDAKDLIVYAIDAFPAEALEAAYPGTVTPLVGNNFSDLSGRRIVKIGCGRRDRVADVRSELNRVLPGHDPRPMFILHVPFIDTDADLKNGFEEPLHVEFSDVRIGHDGRRDIPGPRNCKYTELFVLDMELKEVAFRTAMSLVDRHVRAASADAAKEIGEARQTAHDLAQANMEIRVKDTESHHLRAALQKCELALKKSEEECGRLRDTITNVLPRKMSALKSAFMRSST